MVERLLRRYDVVVCGVSGHQPYGLVIQVGDGPRGYIDSADIADEPVSADRWPAVGEALPCVVLGYTRDGGVRACSSPSYVAFIEGVSDPHRAISTWTRVRDGGFNDPDDRAEFFASPDTVPILRWALRPRADSLDRTRASEILGGAPEELARAVRE
jgi:hypothetical protein